MERQPPWKTEQEAREHTYASVQSLPASQRQLHLLSGWLECHKQDASMGAHSTPKRGYFSQKLLQRGANKLRTQHPYDRKGKANSTEHVGQRVSLPPGHSLCCVPTVFFHPKKTCCVGGVRVSVWLSTTFLPGLHSMCVSGWVRHKVLLSADKQPCV